MGKTRWGRYVKVSLFLVTVTRQRVLLDYICFGVYNYITVDNVVWMLSIMTFCCSRDAHDFLWAYYRAWRVGRNEHSLRILSFRFNIVQTRTCGALPGSRWELGAARGRESQHATGSMDFIFFIRHLTVTKNICD